VGASDQAEFDADVRRIQRELESLPPVTTLEERKLTMEEAAAYLDNVRELWAIATRSEQRTMAQTLFRAVHVDLDAGAIVKADLPPRYRDLLPFIGTEGEETMKATGTDKCVPVAQSARQAHNPMFGRNRRDSRTHYATPPIIWDESELAELPPLPRDLHGCVSKDARRVAGEQDRRAVQERVVALRDEGKTWPEIAAAVGLSHSHVRASYDDCTATQARPDDDMILENIRAFLATGSAPSRRTYGGWPERVVSPATVENRFGSWALALSRARDAEHVSTRDV
jgi:hypothetical protein